MTYIKKQPISADTPISEGVGVSSIKTYTEDNYAQFYDLFVANATDMLDDMNVHASAGIHESKLSGDVNNHPHFADTNLGERTIGDRQLEWVANSGASSGGVYLIRTFRPGMKILWGVTPPLVARAVDSLTYAYPKNLYLRVPFASIHGSSCPFSPGAVIQVVATPQVPPGTNNDVNEYFKGVDWVILGVDSTGFDMWVGTEYMEGYPYFFSYVAMGWEVV